jgi:predicted ferric reductase
MMDAFVLLMSLSFLIQVIVDLIKSWMAGTPLPENFHKYTALFVSLFLGLGLAFETNLGILTAAGISLKHSVVDVITTGLILAGGSNVVNQVVEYLRTARKSTLNPPTN